MKGMSLFCLALLAALAWGTDALAETLKQKAGCAGDCLREVMSMDQPVGRAKALKGCQAKCGWDDIKADERDVYQCLLDCHDAYYECLNKGNRLQGAARGHSHEQCAAEYDKCANKCYQASSGGK